MSAIQQLQAQREQIEAEIAQALQQANARKKRLEEEIARQRAEDVANGKAEIKAVMEKYSLSLDEVFGNEVVLKGNKMKLKDSTYLSELRRFYSSK